jgi:hypothetical protein
MEEGMSSTRCPRCLEGKMKDWHDLSEEEREVVKRLPASAEYSEEERRSAHRWCTRCWFESPNSLNRA